MELLETCTSGNHNDVEEALAKNCDVEIKNEDGWTPLIVAASFNFDRVVENFIMARILTQGHLEAHRL
ncbi:hypothetical protein L914_19601 [Phytophthora nicotianae]|uniref:Uncharacterized protein n=1 Tax=Phytophthora nicotianae TaxID=4792 RepID=W2M9T9_PHYNI|nr:hypothetical protein L914_19601 [Phytophthora nicotianae]